MNISTFAFRSFFGLAEDKKIGFFLTDNSTQTVESDVLELKNTTSLLYSLWLDSQQLKKEVRLAWSSTEAQYDDLIERKSHELYCRANDKITDLEKEHMDRVETTRRAFKQQLTDALFKLQGMFDNDLKMRMASAKNKYQSEEKKHRAEIRELVNKIQEQASVIQNLRTQLQDMPSYSPPDILHEFVQTSPFPNQERHQSAKVIYKEDHAKVERLNQRIADDEEKLGELTDRLVSERQKTDEWRSKAESLEQELACKAEELKQLSLSRRPSPLEKEEPLNSTPGLDPEERQRLEEEFQLKLEQAIKDTETRVTGELTGKLDMESVRQHNLKSEILRLRTELTEYKERVENMSSEEKDRLRLQEEEKRLKEEVCRLTKELERVNRMWERKFSVLQQSLHALKDEMFIRQNLQRQSAQLHSASVAYLADEPLGVRPWSERTDLLHARRRRPLPSLATVNIEGPLTVRSPVTFETGADQLVFGPEDDALDYMPFTAGTPARVVPPP